MTLDDDRHRHWLVRRRTIRGLWIGSNVVLTITVLLNLVVPQAEVFGIEGVFGFAAWYGLLTCIVMILVAKGLGFILKRPDTYYDDA